MSGDGSATSAPSSPRRDNEINWEENCIKIFSTLTRVHDHFVSIGEAIAVEHGLHIAELNVIDTLGRGGAMSMGALSRETFISPSNTTHTVKKLEVRGLVTRGRSEQSDRVVIVQVTDAGKDLFTRCFPEVEGSISDLLNDRIGAEGRLQLESLLTRLLG